MYSGICGRTSSPPQRTSSPSAIMIDDATLGFRSRALGSSTLSIGSTYGRVNRWAESTSADSNRAHSSRSVGLVEYSSSVRSWINVFRRKGRT